MLYDFEPLIVCSVEPFLQVKYVDKSLVFLYLQDCLQTSSQWSRSGELWDLQMFQTQVSDMEFTLNRS